MTIFSVVVWYFPTPKEISNIYSYSNHVDHIYIFDNSENQSHEHLIHLDSSKYTYYWNKENQGLSKPLNVALKLAIEQDYDWLLCMDQDSEIPSENIDAYFEFIKTSNNSNVGIYGLNYTTESILFNGENIIENVDFLITSGSMINLNLINQHKIQFDEKLFIDGIDTDFSFQLKLAGLNSILIKSNYMIHSIGEPVTKTTLKTFYTRQKTKHIHSPIRMYYTTRNLLYLKYKYRHNKSIVYHFKSMTQQHWRYFWICFFYSDKSISIIKYALWAYIDFYKSKMGKYAH